MQASLEYIGLNYKCLFTPVIMGVGSIHMYVFVCTIGRQMIPCNFSFPERYSNIPNIYRVILCHSFDNFIMQ